MIAGQTGRSSKIHHNLVRAQIIGDGPCPIWGTSAVERHRRILQRAGFNEILLGADAQSITAPCLIINGEFIVDENLFGRLLLTPDTLLIAEDPQGRLRAVAAHVDKAGPAEVGRLIASGEAIELSRLPAGLQVKLPDQLGSSFNRTLRKRAKPYALALTTANVADLEWRTFQESYKGATDFVTKLIWPVPAFHVTRACAALNIRPNAVTTAGLLLMLLATALFWNGWLLLGTLPAWGMTFLDTVDGKLARCTMTSSRWGDRYDHGVDLLHPPLWYYAWWVGIGTDEPITWLALWVILGGYVVGRLMELTFKVLYGIQTHIWRPLDYWFRAITARRNPNLAILTVAALLGLPETGFLIVAVWTVLSLSFHLVRIVQAGVVKSTGRPITSWLSEPVVNQPEFPSNTLGHARADT